MQRRGSLPGFGRSCDDGFREDACSRAATAIQPGEAATGSVVPEENRQRRIIVFIDNTTLHPLRRNEVLNSVKDSLATLLRPGDDVMVAAWGRSEQTFSVAVVDRVGERVGYATARFWGVSDGH